MKNLLILDLDTLRHAFVTKPFIPRIDEVLGMDEFYDGDEDSIEFYPEVVQVVNFPSALFLRKVVECADAEVFEDFKKADLIKAIEAYTKVSNIDALVLIATED